MERNVEEFQQLTLFGEVPKQEEPKPHGLHLNCMIPLSTYQALRVWSAIEHAVDEEMAVRMVRDLKYHDGREFPEQQIRDMWQRYDNGRQMR